MLQRRCSLPAKLDKIIYVHEEIENGTQQFAKGPVPPITVE